MHKFYKYLIGGFIGLGIGIGTEKGYLDFILPPEHAEKIILGGFLLAIVVSEALGYFGIIKLGPPIFPWEEKEDE